MNVLLRITLTSFIVLVLAVLSGLRVNAQTVEQLKQSIAAKTQEIKNLEAEIDKYKSDLSKIATLKVSLKTLIAELETTRKKLDTEIRITTDKVDTTDLEIKKLDSDISYKKDQIEGFQMALREALRDIAERDTTSLPAVALSNDTFFDFWGDIDQMGQFNDVVTLKIDNIAEAKSDLENIQFQKQGKKKELLDLKSELSDRKQVAEQTKKEKAALLAQTSNQESQFTKILKQKIALKDAFEKELNDYEATLKFILDPSSIPSRGSKVFAAPLDDMYITQRFGSSSARGPSGQRLYASGTHNGIDLRASIGTPVRAMQKGTVVGVGDTDATCPRASFGKWVFIRYNNGLASTYGHLSLIKATQGQEVNAGDIVGYSGNTGYSTGPHLHVSVYASAGVNVESRPSKTCGGRIYTMPFAALSAYLDPLDYL